MKRAIGYLALLTVAGLISAGVVLLPGHEASAARPRQQVRHAAVAVPDPAGLQVVGRPARVALYGDSLASEAVKPFIDAVTVNGRAEVRTGVFGGTAICDWFDQMRQDAAWQPDAVVVEFSGNALTACMANGRTSGTAWLQRYYTDAAAVLSIFPSTRVYFVATPISRSLAESHDPNAGDFVGSLRDPGCVRGATQAAAVAGSHPASSGSAKLRPWTGRCSAPYPRKNGAACW